MPSEMNELKTFLHSAEERMMKEYAMLLLFFLLCILNICHGLQTKILFATLYNIREYDLDTESVKDVTNIIGVNSIDFDSNGFVYCSSIYKSFIRRFRYPLEDNSTTTVVLNEDEPLEIDLDPARSQLYWVDMNKHRIQRSDIYGRNIKSVKSIDMPTSLDFGIKNRWMYFITCNDIESNNASCMIQRSLLDGNDIQIIVNHMPKARNLRSDPDHERLYWIEYEKGIIKSAFLNGSDVQQVFNANSTEKWFYSLDIYENHIYFSYSTYIIRINKLIADEYTILYNGTDSFYDVINALRVYDNAGKHTCNQTIDALEKTLQELTVNYTRILNQITPTESCLLPYQKIGDGCYFIGNDSVSGDEAFASCTQPGEYLANFETLEEAMTMKMFLQQMNTGMHYFIGGRNINRYLPNGDWRWIKNGNATQMTYFAFGVGQPGSSANDEQDCMVVYAHARYTFYDVSCDHSNYHGGYICEK